MPWISCCLKQKGNQQIRKMFQLPLIKNLEYYVNNERINGEYIEIELKKALEGQEKPTIILRAEESVAIKGSR